jgi:hypothetical protein
MPCNYLMNARHDVLGRGTRPWECSGKVLGEGKHSIVLQLGLSLLMRLGA